MVSGFGPQRGAYVAQAFLLYLRNAPELYILILVIIKNIGEIRPIVETGICDGATEGIAMAAYIFGQGIDAETSIDRLG